MRIYHYIFLAVKIAIVVQFILILANKELFDSKYYTITEVVFKTFVGVFIQLFLLNSQIKDVIFEDKVIISFAGGLLLFDAWFNDLPLALKEFNVPNPFAFID